jgi:hypothetical protein
MGGPLDILGGGGQIQKIIMQVVKVEKQFLQALGERKKIIVQLHEKSN